jgi:hypothetical protein
MRLPLHILRPSAAQEQIACCTNLGNTFGKLGLNVRASMQEEMPLMMSAQPTPQIDAMRDLLRNDQ